MKQIRITYRMNDGENICETHVTLPMSNGYAEELLSKGENGAVYICGVHSILEELSSLQGCTYSGFCTAELDGMEGVAKP